MKSSRTNVSRSFEARTNAYSSYNVTSKLFLVHLEVKL